MLLASDSHEYAEATKPDNSVTPQNPAFVVMASQPADISDAVAGAATRSLQLVPQATGHGAGAEVGDGDILVDTSRLNAISIDPRRRTATVGAGVTWGALNAEAQKHGLLGPAGSSPSVSVSGYTFAGGIGWLVRAHGLASSALKRVNYVDGSGALRTASDDADAALDRDAIWAFRGAGGVGIATELEIELFPAPDLHAGALLWHASDLKAVVEAWADTIGSIGPSASSSIGILHIPPAPSFPEELRGSVAVHLAIADPDGPNGATALIDAMRRAAAPVSDDWGPSDAERLGLIHLDPTSAVPALGDARWLDEAATSIAVELFSTAVAADSPLVEMEIRHVGGHRSVTEGAMTTVRSPFLFHTVGALGRSTRDQIDGGIARARAVWSQADTGLAPGSWIEGAAHVTEAMTPDELERARAIADAVDPDHRIRRSRLLG